MSVIDFDTLQNAEKLTLIDFRIVSYSTVGYFPEVTSYRYVFVTQIVM